MKHFRWVLHTKCCLFADVSRHNFRGHGDLDLFISSENLLQSDTSRLDMVPINHERSSRVKSCAPKPSSLTQLVRSMPSCLYNVERMPYPMARVQAAPRHLV